MEDDSFEPAKVRDTSSPATSSDVAAPLHDEEEPCGLEFPHGHHVWFDGDHDDDDHFCPGVVGEEPPAAPDSDEVAMHVAALDSLETILFGDCWRRSRDEMEARAEQLVADVQMLATSRDHWRELAYRYAPEELKANG